MKTKEQLIALIKDHNNIITVPQAEALGFSRTTLSRYVESGELERVGQGIYALTDAMIDDLYLLTLRSKKIILSHDTALFLNGLSERTPFIHSVTFPSNTSVPKSIEDQCVKYFIKPELHEVGLAELETTFGNKVRCYNVERTLCDLLRSRHRIDVETVISAVKNYASYAQKDLNLLAEYGELFKVNHDLRKYLEVLL